MHCSVIDCLYRVIAVFVKFLIIAYPQLAAKGFEMFNCIEKEDGETYLIKQESIWCPTLFADLLQHCSSSTPNLEFGVDS